MKIYSSFINNYILNIIITFSNTTLNLKYFLVKSTNNFEKDILIIKINLRTQLKR